MGHSKSWRFWDGENTRYFRSFCREVCWCIFVLKIRTSLHSSVLFWFLRMWLLIFDRSLCNAKLFSAWVWWSLTQHLFWRVLSVSVSYSPWHTRNCFTWRRHLVLSHQFGCQSLVLNNLLGSSKNGVWGGSFSFLFLSGKQRTILLNKELNVLYLRVCLWHSWSFFYRAFLPGTRHHYGSEGLSIESIFVMPMVDFSDFNVFSMVDHSPSIIIICVRLIILTREMPTRILITLSIWNLQRRYAWIYNCR